MNSLPQQATEAAITKAASAVTFGGGTSAVLFGLSSSQWSSLGVIGGMAIAAVGLLVNIWFRWQHLQLAKRRLTAEPDEEDA